MILLCSYFLLFLISCSLWEYELHFWHFFLKSVSKKAVWAEKNVIKRKRKYNIFWVILFYAFWLFLLTDKNVSTWAQNNAISFKSVFNSSNTARCYIEAQRWNGVTVLKESVHVILAECFVDVDMTWTHMRESF